MSLYVKTYKKSQRLAIRFPRQSTLSTEQRSRFRRLSGRMLIWIVAGLGFIVLIVWLTLLPGLVAAALFILAVRASLRRD